MSNLNAFMWQQLLHYVTDRKQFFSWRPGNSCLSEKCSVYMFYEEKIAPAGYLLSVCKVVFWDSLYKPSARWWSWNAIATCRGRWALVAHAFQRFPSLYLIQDPKGQKSICSTDQMNIFKPNVIWVVGRGWPEIKFQEGRVVWTTLLEIKVKET